MRTTHIAAALALAAAVSMAAPVRAQAPARLVHIELPVAGQRLVLKETIRGYAGVDYAFDGRAGRRVQVILRSRNRSAYFNVLREGHDEALFIGSMGGERFTMTVPADGAYRIQVYLMRNAARRGEQAPFELQLR